MLDILLKQMELQDIEQHMGINTSVCENVCRLLKCMVTATAGTKTNMGTGCHVCTVKVRIEYILSFIINPTLVTVRMCHL